MERERFTASLLEETLVVRHAAQAEEASDPDELPVDVDEEVPGS